MATINNSQNSVSVEHEELQNSDGKSVESDVYVQTPNDNKKIDEEAGNNAFDALKPVSDIDTTSFAGHALSEEFINLSTQYGNNVFELEVEHTQLFGVLTEIPALSLGGTWLPNTVAHIIESLKNLQTNTKVQIINSIFGVKQIPWIAGGDATSRTYAGCTDTTFNLQFRIYSMEAIGPSNLMTGYKRMLAALCLYAPPLHTFDAKDILALSVTNIGRTATALAKEIKNTADYASYKVGLTDVRHSPEEQSKIVNGIKTGISDLADVGSAMVSAFCADSSAERTTQIKNFSKAITNAANDLQNAMVADKLSVPDVDRVNDPLNYYNGYYGGALWHLSILPGIFSHKLPVYVQSWTVKPSKEIDSTGKAAYMDFTVTCVLDQIKTGNWWANEIYAPEAEAYKKVYKQQVKTFS
jgi:hypothetical protein